MPTTCATRLGAASASGDSDLVLALLADGDYDDDNDDEDGWVHLDIAERINASSSLHRAAQGGHTHTVRLLLDHGADIDWVVASGDTALSVAAARNHATVVGLLLERGAAVDQQNETESAALHAAALSGGIETVQLLLDRGASVNIVDEKGNTPLCIASQHGFAEIVRLLLAADAGVDATNRDGATPLYSAACNGHGDVVELLLDCGARIGVKRPKGWSPLCIASYVGHDAVVSVLLDRGADINVADVEGATPLYMAADQGHVEIVQLLLDRGASPDTQTSDGFTPLFAAASKQHADVIQALLTGGASVDIPSSRSWTPLHAACFAGHVDAAGILLDSGAAIDEVNCDGDTALSKACSKGQFDTVQLLLDHGVAVNSVNHKGFSVMLHAAQHGHLEIELALVDHGASVDIADEAGTTPLHAAAWGGHTSVVTALLDAGADADVVDLSGITPLFGASSKGFAEVVQALLSRGARTDILSSDGDSAFGVASHYGHLAAAVALLDHGAEVDFANSRGRTALFASSLDGHFQVTEELLRRGASVHIADADGSTPLSAASSKGDTSIAVLLLDQDARVDCANEIGCTPLHRSSANGHLDVVHVLLERGADVNSVDCRGETALHHASGNNHMDVVAFLLEESADADAKSASGVTPLLTACQAGHLLMVAILLDQVSSVGDSDVEGNTPLIAACQAGHMEVVKILIEKEASLETVNVDLQTPLLVSASCGHFSIVRVLLLAGACADARDADGETLLTYAARWGLIGVAGMLIEAGWHPMAGVAGVKAPLVAATLQALALHSSEMHEFKDVWDSVVVRLVDIYTYLQQEWAADATSIPQNIGRRFVRILVRFTGLKVVCEEANIFVRLVASRKIVSSIQDFHAEIDHLLRRLERDWSEPMHSEWLGRLSDEQSAIMERFETEAQDENLLASELEEDTTQVEALCLLEYEKQEHSDIYNQGHLDLLELFLEKILQFVGDAESVPEWFIPSHEITIGPQSSVYEPHNRLYRGTWLNSNVLISKCDAAQDRFVEACSVWVQLSHPNVISLFGAYHLRAPYLAVFENVSSTSLMDFLAAEGNQRGMWQKMYEVALGLGYLHERKIVLGDLRCDDIWIDKDGLAMIPGSAFEERSVDSDGMAMQWLPPEVMRGEEPSLASDVYAFGICIVEAVAGKSPWPDWTEYSVYSDTKAEFLPARPDAMDRHQWYLIQSMCRFDPSERVSMAFATEHLKFFAIQESSQAEETPALSGGVCCNLRAYIVPELSSSIEAALENLEARCSMASDACDLALHVHARLVNVFELLQEMHKLPRDVEVTKFCDVLVMLYTFLRAAISETSVIERAKSRKVSLKANVLHREVDALLGLLSFDVIDPVHSWTPKLAVSAVTRLGTVNESPDDEEKTDEPRTVKLLRFEAKHLNRRYDAIDIEMLNTLIAEGDRPPWFIPIHELRYQREDSVGTGAFGAVYRGMWLGTSVVVKFMGYEDDTDTENLEMFFHELRVWHPLHHPHVVRLFGACHLGKRFFVCEYATNGTLYDFLQRDENRERTWKRLYELALGLQYLHKENIVHNDLKCDNFLVGSDGKAKISDFGLSCIPNSAEVKIDPKLQGAQQWKSPEYLRGDRLRLASDIYSFGMCILEAVTGAAPWGRMLDVFVRMKVRKSLLPPRPESMSDEQFNLVEMMCTPDPVHRLQIASVVERLDEFSQESKRCTSRSRFRRLKSYAPS